MAFEVGQSVGNYCILRKLGAGGMGEVFLAEHPLIGKTVALKVIHQDLSVNKEVVARFINEAKAVSTLGSEHIVDVHDFGVSEEGAHFFIMEYLEGQTLTGWVRGGPIPVDVSLHIAAQIAAGLATAHDKGIVHRDLKPDNIMLVEKLGDPNFVKILDFGLAKMLEASEQLTAMGVVLGTPEFMSPEAAESKGVDGRSDVYSLGVLLFQMLTARLPFTANSMGEMMVQHVVSPPPVPRAFNPKIPPAVDQIVLRCLAKSKDDRFQSMAELRQALLNPDAYLAGSPAVVASNGAKSSVSSNHPAMAKPATTVNRTMSIEAPQGYSAAKRGRVMILVLIAMISAAGGSAAALIQPMDESTKAESDAASAGKAAPGDAGAINTPTGALPVEASAGDAGPGVEPPPGETAPITPPDELPVTKVPATTVTEPSDTKPRKKPRRPKKPKGERGDNMMAPAF